jgi:hypothetical protein
VEDDAGDRVDVAGARGERVAPARQHDDRGVERDPDRADDADQRLDAEGLAGDRARRDGEPDREQRHAGRGGRGGRKSPRRFRPTPWPVTRKPRSRFVS